MKLLIIRHGQAQTTAASDSLRDLTEYGREQAVLVGRCIAEQNLDFNHVWCSPYNRAQQTAAIALNYASLDSPHIETMPLITPDNNPQDVVDAINQSAIENLILVSHQPLVSSLVGLFVDCMESAGPPMAPASMALLEGDILMSGCCSLSWLRHAPSYERSQ